LCPKMGFIASSGNGLDTTRPRADAMKGVMNMNIEPMISEKTRMAGMTPEDRRLRQQWVEDQYLTEREPVRVPALIYRNNFKRLFGYPLDMTFKFLIKKHVMHPNTAIITRWLLGKSLLMCTGMGLALYYLRHNQAHWERVSGFVIIPARKPCYPGDPGWDDPDHGKTTPESWCANRYFYDRTIFLCPETLKTSSETATEISRRNAGLL